MMANPRQRMLMQEALDETISPERLRELHDQLDQSPGEAAAFSRMRQVDRLLKTAPMENAPEGLALRVLARLAEGLQTQKIVRPTSLALALGLALTALGLMPLLGIIGYLLISVLGSASALSALLHQLVILLGAVVQTLNALVTSAQAVLQTYPEVPVFMLTMIPAGLLWIWWAARQGGADQGRTHE
ncbi:MAG: hypothetical protein SF162_11315 [bacterium]|nr:hypothetical protein [bacterium]